MVRLIAFVPFGFNFFLNGASGFVYNALVSNGLTRHSCTPLVIYKVVAIAGCLCGSWITVFGKYLPITLPPK